MVVPDAHDDLWSKVLGCAAKRKRAVFHLLCETEICDFQVPVSRYEQVLWLDVSVGHFVRMKVLERCNDLRHVEERHIVREEIFAAQQTENFSALDVLKGQVDVSFVLERLVTARLKPRALTGSR